MTVHSPTTNGRAAKGASLEARNDFPSIALGDRPLFDHLRELYMYREQDLVAAVASGNQREARRIINHLLVHIYSAGQERSDLLKGLLLELVVVVSRAVVERGASPSDLLGLGFRHLTELAEMEDDEDLAQWLRDAFDRIFAAASQLRAAPTEPVVNKALAYMRAHLHEDLSREVVARQAGASAGRLSRLLKERTGHSFVDLLRELRIEQAARRLTEGDDGIAAIAMDCGFCDQSYFTRVFHAARGLTPGEYRAAAGASRNGVTA